MPHVNPIDDSALAGAAPAKNCGSDAIASKEHDNEASLTSTSIPAELPVALSAGSQTKEQIITLCARDLEREAYHAASETTAQFHVCVGGDQTDGGTGVDGGGVAGTRISPECRFFMTSGRQVLLDALTNGSGGSSRGRRPVLELGSGHGCLGAWASAVLRESTSNQEGLEQVNQQDTAVWLSDVSGFLYVAEATAAANNKRVTAVSQHESPAGPSVEVEKTETPDKNSSTSFSRSSSSVLRTVPLHFGDTEMLDGVVNRIMSISANDQGREYEINRGGAPVLIGAAITYWDCVYEPLARTIQHFCRGREDGIVLLGYFRRSWSTEKRFFTKLLKGLDVEVVAEAFLEDEWDPQIWAPICSRDLHQREWNTRIYKITAKRCSSGSTPPDQVPGAADPPKHHPGPQEDEKEDPSSYLDPANGGASWKKQKELEATIQRERQQQERMAAQAAAKGKKGKKR